ncbi:hypothetical protein [Amycolatopsis sp. A1MSW2902]|uniref:hypothetical protein n=1 Tax=Amycolatopsis sp. A1MSW2902 TaxID=687413 RepID=UPI00307F8EE7
MSEDPRKARPRIPSNPAARFPASWKVVLYGILPCMFVALFLAGAWLDSIGYWSNKPFVTNVVTAATSACAGIPIAVGIIQKIITIQEERRQLRTTLTVLDDNIDQLTDAILLTYSGSSDALKEVSALLRFCESRTHTLLPFVFPGETLDRELVAELQRFRKDVVDLRSKVQEIISESKYGPAVQTMYDAAWESLDSYVRPRLRESGIAWLPKDSYLILKQESLTWISDESLLKEIRYLIEAIDFRSTSGQMGEARGEPPVHNLLWAAKNLDRFIAIRGEIPAIQAVGSPLATGR